MDDAYWFRQRAAAARRIGVNLEHPQAVYARILSQIVSDGDRWLEIGCGRQIVPHWAMRDDRQVEMVRRTQFLVGIDADSAIREHPFLTHRVYAFGDHLPFRPESFDVVSANMVMEHVEDPAQLLREVFSVLRPGGSFLFHTPNYRFFQIFIASLIPQGIKNKLILILERRKEEDVFPTRYRINTPAAITRHAAGGGFEVTRLEVAGPYGSLRRLGPLAVAEVLLLKVFAFEAMRHWRSNFIVQLRKPGRRPA